MVKKKQVADEDVVAHYAIACDCGALDHSFRISEYTHPIENGELSYYDLDLATMIPTGSLWSRVKLAWRILRCGRGLLIVNSLINPRHAKELQEILSRYTTIAEQAKKDMEEFK